MTDIDELERLHAAAPLCGGRLDEAILAALPGLIVELRALREVAREARVLAVPPLVGLCAALAKVPK